MQELAIGNWLLKCDREATRAAYALIPSGGAKECGCIYCRNYVLARDTIFQGSVRSLFEQLGIDCTKDAEVCEYGRDAGGKRLYDGWFHFIGEIIRTPPGSSESASHTYTLSADPSLEISSLRRSDLAHPLFQGRPLVQIEFTTPLAWVLDEPEPP